MAKQHANEILESDEKDLVILSYLGTKVFRKTPGNEKLRQWWLTNKSGLRDLVKKIRDSAAFWESCSDGYMSNQLATEILESDENDSFIVFCLGRKLFRKTPDKEQHRQWWLANSEFTEDDLDLILTMANLFQPMDTSQFDHVDRGHINRYCSNSDDQFVGADSPVTYSGLRDLVKKIRGSAAFKESLAIPN
ncbi:hypothetical protein AG4045_030738 [Apium graveolens]|uniref:Uncharacterized protein n=1 Tax=Apium graveolens TaxID=4045 RepID=A0A6L5B838_APIGR|nr:hypothetical protein AG4045_030738 [Apium graveolens]